MKQNKNKIGLVVILLIIIAGIAMMVMKGFAFDLKYQDTKRVEIALGGTFSIEDVRAITKDVFGNEPVMLQKVEVFEDAVSITAKNITDEQKQGIIDRVNEKFGTEVKAEEVDIITVAHTRARDLLKPYIFPFAVATIVILVYMAIRYHSLSSIKVIAQTLAIVILSQAVLFSIMAITRIPIGRLTIPLVLVVYLLSLIGCTNRFEKMRKKDLEEIEEN